MAHPAAIGVELPAAHWSRPGAGRGGHCGLEEGALARAKKNAARERRTIVFVDESGLSERPHRCRTWAPRGQTPVLQYHFHWNMLSAIAGVTWWNFYVQLHAGTINAPRVVEFLRHLLRHVRGKLLIIWDGLPAHRSRLVQDFAAAQTGRITLERLPGYAPELNPVEYLWGYWKEHALPNLCPKDFWELSDHARRSLRRMRRRPSLIIAFWSQADLFL
jgi:transposase